jgi:hypothetical protein
MSIDALGQLTREERLKRRLPPNAVCAHCGEAGHLRTSAAGETLCYACRRARGGARSFEADHLAGRAHLGAITLNLRQNDHRTVTELRTVLGMDDWPSPDTSSGLALVHLLGSVSILLWLAATWLLEFLQAPPSAAQGAVS